MQSIEEGFSLSATTYDANANVQRFAADQLLQLIDLKTERSVSGTILELGCGTGYLSEKLLEYFPENSISLLDVSPAMIENTYSRLTKHTGIVPSNAQFLVDDAETFFHSSIRQDDSYALIASSFTFQWFRQPENTIGQLIAHLQDGGRLLFSTPIAGSFDEWHSIVKRLDLKFTANELPKADDFVSIARHLNCKLEIHELQFKEHFNHALAFFHSLKHLGANTSLHSSRNCLTPAQLRQLMRAWDSQSENRIRVTYRILQGCFTK
jgi:malonyl-CoA O-methyltransferase